MIEKYYDFYYRHVGLSFFLNFLLERVEVSILTIDGTGQWATHERNFIPILHKLREKGIIRNTNVLFWKLLYDIFLI